MSLFDDVLGDDNMFTEAPYGPQEGYAEYCYALRHAMGTLQMRKHKACS